MEGVSDNIIQRLTKIVGQLEELSLGVEKGDTPQTNSEHSTETDNSTSIKAFDTLIDSQLLAFCTLSEKIGGDVLQHAGLIREAFLLKRRFLAIIGEHAAPANLEELNNLLKPLKDQIESIVQFREVNRRSEYFNHLSTVSESITALGWITITNPPKYIKEMQNAGQFYCNRVLKDFRQVDQVHCDWVRAWMTLLTGLEDFTRQHHRTGLSWNQNGTPLTADAVGGPLCSTGTVSAPLDTKAQKGETTTDKAVPVAVAGAPRQLSTETAEKEIKIDTDNSNQRKDEKQGQLAMTQLDGTKWRVEHHENASNVVIEGTDLKHTVYIFNCHSSAVHVHGKVNTIILDNCNKIGLVFDEVIASLQIVNCRRVQVQVTEGCPTSCPTIACDKDN